jgi:hypothetical protein
VWQTTREEASLGTGEAARFSNRRDSTQLGARRGIEVALGDKGDDSVTLIPHACAC